VKEEADRGIAAIEAFLAGHPVTADQPASVLALA